MSGERVFPANLELRESDDEGRPIAGLSHKPGGMFLLFVQELASQGEPRGALTFVHDAGDHGGRYLALANELAARGWAVSLPDMRGHGRSEGERGHSGGIEEVVRDLEEVQNHLAYMAPSAPRVLAGTGLGALWALASACEHPEALVGLALVNPLLEPRFELPEPAGGLRKLFRKVGPKSAGSTGCSPDALTAVESERAALRADPLVHQQVSLRAGTQALEAAARYGPRLGSLGIPTLVLQGTGDPLGSVERVRALSGDSLEVELVEGARHDLFHDAQAERAVRAFGEWLDRLPLGP